jgi:hypothetical protein
MQQGEAQMDHIIGEKVGNVSGYYVWQNKYVKHLVITRYILWLFFSFFYIKIFGLSFLFLIAKLLEFTLEKLNFS